MKYEVPEINISKFSVENIVTVSAATAAETAINGALENNTITGAVGSGSNRMIYRTTMDQWVD